MPVHVDTVTAPRDADQVPLVQVAIASLIVIGLSSAPYMSMWRWLTHDFNDVSSWPYLASVWLPAIAGTCCLVVDRTRERGLTGAGRPQQLTTSLPLTVLVAVCVLGGWVIASTQWTQAPAPSDTFANACLAVLILGCGTWFGMFLRPRAIVACIFASMQLLTIGSLVAVAVAPSARFSPWIGDRSWLGLFGNPNSLGPVAGLALLSTILLLPELPAQWRIGVAAFAVADVVVLIGASSVTAWLAVSTAVMGLILASAVGRIRNRSCAAVPVLLGLALVAILAWNAPSLARWFGKDRTFSGRTDAWRYAAASVAPRRVIGFGFNAFWSDPQHQFGYMESTGRDWIASSHSTFIDIYVDLGIVGVVVVAVVVLLGLSLVGTAAVRTPGAGARAWLAIGVFALVENIAESMMLLHSVFWMLLIAACVAGATLSGDPQLERSSRLEFRRLARVHRTKPCDPVSPAQRVLVHATRRTDESASHR